MKISPDLQLRFRDYVRDVADVRQNLEFLLENLKERVDLDGSRESLEALEAAFWRVKEVGIPSELSDESQMVWLMTQYLADAIIRKTGAKWVQATDSNPMFGQPALDQFGNEKWDRIYPVALANSFANLHRSNPMFPGVRDRKVLARMFDKALRIHELKPSR